MASHDISQEIQDDVLSCAICNNHLTEPKALPCLHTYCCNCLQELARRADNRRLRCPECRKVVEVPIGGVQAFPTNFLLANVLENVQQCKEEKKKQADETDMCDVHRQEAQVVCDTCNVVVCTVCLKSGHKEHALKHIDQEKAKKMKQLEKLIKETTDVSGDLSRVKQRLQVQQKDIRRQIESRAAVVIHKVECQKKSLLEEIDKQKERKLEKIVRIERQHSGQKRKMAAKLSAVKAIRNNNKQLLYKNILSHISCLTAATSETAEYQAKQAAPLLGEVRRLKFVPSSLDQPLLGHIDEGSDGPSGSNPKPSTSGTSGNVAKAGTKKRAGVSFDDESDSLSSSDNNDDNTSSRPAPKRRKAPLSPVKKYWPSMRVYTPTVSPSYSYTRKRASESFTSDDWDHLNSSDVPVDEYLGHASPMRRNTGNAPINRYGCLACPRHCISTASSRISIEESASTASSSNARKLNAARPIASTSSGPAKDDDVKRSRAVAKMRICHTESDEECYVEEEFDTDEEQRQMEGLSLSKQLVMRKAHH